MPSRKSQTIYKENHDKTLSSRPPGRPVKMKKARPILKDVQNALALHAPESRRYVIVQEDSSSGISYPAYPAFKSTEVQKHRRYPVAQRTLSSEANSTYISQPRIRTVLPTAVPSPREQVCGSQRRHLVRQPSVRRSSSMIVSRSLDSLLSISPGAEGPRVAIGLHDASSKGLRSNTQTNSTVKAQTCASRSHRVDRDALLSLSRARTSTPPLSPPPPSSLQASASKSSKRAGRTYALVPTEVNGQHVFTHTVVSDHASNGGENLPNSPCSTDAIGFPEDMRNVLRQLDELATWVKAASSKECISAVSTVASVALADRFPDRHESRSQDGHDTDPNIPGSRGKGKGRRLSTPPSPSEHGRTIVEVSGQSQTCQLSNAFERTKLSWHHSEGFIYEPQNTPEFLVGSSKSPVAYPVKGYCSPPPGLSAPSRSHGSSTAHHIAYGASCQSALDTPLTAPLVSPPSGKTTFKGFFQRSKFNTAVVSRSSIPLGHVPVESAFSRERRMRLPWLKI
ncbi:hypothetical protein F5I97DRAFT_1923279 [Phlebopus sp. FC_14]|nr:hypothetical protein F5I97DRAFT_1923279 [Phlebopus sp. FC_14]